MNSSNISIEKNGKLSFEREKFFVGLTKRKKASCLKMMESFNMTSTRNDSMPTHSLTEARKPVPAVKTLITKYKNQVPPLTDILRNFDNYEASNNYTFLDSNNFLKKSKAMTKMKMKMKMITEKTKDKLVPVIPYWHKIEDVDVSIPAKKIPYSQTEDCEQQSEEFFDPVDLETKKLKESIKKFFVGGMKTVQKYEKDMSLAQFEHKKFYSSRENQINFLEDIYFMPNIKNNLVLTCKKSHLNQSKNSIRDRLESLKTVNSFNQSTLKQLNKLKKKFQIEKDLMSNCNAKEKSNEKKKSMTYKKIVDSEEQIEMNMILDSVFYDYFRGKYDKYREVKLAEGRERAEVLKIDPKRRVKFITARIFKELIGQSIQFYSSISDVIKEHLDLHDKKKRAGPTQRIFEKIRSEPSAKLNNKASSGVLLKQILEGGGLKLI